MWCFRTQGSSLWSKDIKGIHGEDGKLDMHVNNCHPSIWLDIVCEVKKLKNIGIDLLALFIKSWEMVLLHHFGRTCGEEMQILNLFILDCLLWNQISPLQLQLSCLKIVYGLFFVEI